MPDPLRILLIEDVPADAELIQHELRKAGLLFEVKCVASKRAFLAELRAGPVDAIISDFSMPQFNALDALHALQAHHVEIPFVLVTGSQSEEVAVECIKEGADDYILKTSLKRLPSALVGAMQKKKAQREKEAAEKALRLSEEYFRTLINASSDIIAIVAPDGVIRFASASIQANLGYMPSELIDQSYFEYVHAADLRVVQDTFAHELKGRNNSRPLEYRIRHKDGSWKTIETAFHNVAHNPAVRGLVLNSRDITERKRLEAHFLRAQRMESIGTLAGGIAHDLNNVLTPIIMSLKLIRDLRGDTPEDLIDTLETTAHRGAAIVQQVLSFARGAEGERAPLQLKHPLSEVFKIAKDVFPPSIQIKFDVDPNLWPVIGDPTQLHQVFMNLFVNSRDAMPHGGRLDVECRNVSLDENYCSMQAECKPGRYVMTSVSDTGVGIPPALLGKIFEPFFTTKEQGKGTGLGLSTAMGIIRSHGGFLNVYSEPGKGTCFKVCLPACEVSRVETGERQREKLASGNGECVLVVDDEAAIREIIKVTLENNGYKVITANDGAEAVGTYASNQKQIQAVIVDVMMPFMDGPSTIRALSRIEPNARFIAISGLMESTRIAQLSELGNVTYLAKPFTTEQILATLGAVLAPRPR